MPWIALGAAAITAVGSVASSANNVAPTSMQTAYDTTTELLFDSSGFSVNTGGGGRIDTTRTQAPAGVAAAEDLQKYFPYMLFALAGVALWKISK